MSSPESEKKDAEFGIPFSDNFRNFFSQIHEFPHIIKKISATDHQLLKQLEDLKLKAELIIKELNEKKPELLNQFDKWLKPTVKEVIEKLLHDAEALKLQLDCEVEELHHLEKLNWLDYARQWKELILVWHDRNHLENSILNNLSKRSNQLIEKDIRIIQDYQAQSLAHLPKESDAFRNLEKRLTNAIDEPMRELFALQKECHSDFSLKQASEWVANLYQQRENYFDKLLMKIDNVVKEIVQADEIEDLSAFAEDESEIVFMEREIMNVEHLISTLQSHQKSAIAFTRSRLDDMLEHASQLKENRIPQILQTRILVIKEKAEAHLAYLDHFNRL